jgi:hypothetical protein
MSITLKSDDYMAPGTARPRSPVRPAVPAPEETLRPDSLPLARSPGYGVRRDAVTFGHSPIGVTRFGW